MHIFPDNFHQGGKYSAQIASHHAEFRREETFSDQKSLSISSLQTEYINLNSSSGYGKTSKRANIVQTKYFFWEVPTILQENVSKVLERR